ncbi:MAG: hypothetical protein WBIAU1_02640 [Wolbachia endosymbiont of Drosophila biauraria]|nr:MAG: hypothetical protein WBIAU1_02640 [Wolbachia endosymbiont of Drosophila biauraria]
MKVGQKQKQHNVFFQNENVKESDILATHINKTVERTKAHKRVLVIQDTSYIVYNNHKKQAD